MLGLTLTDTELTSWLTELRHTADAAHLAAAKATGDEHTLTMLAKHADVATRRHEYLRSRALVKSSCTWCSAIGEPCEDCKGRSDG